MRPCSLKPLPSHQHDPRRLSPAHRTPGAHTLKVKSCNHTSLNLALDGKASCRPGRIRSNRLNCYKFVPDKQDKSCGHKRCCFVRSLCQTQRSSDRPARPAVLFHKQHVSGFAAHTQQCAGRSRSWYAPAPGQRHAQPCCGRTGPASGCWITASIQPLMLQTPWEALFSSLILIQFDSCQRTFHEGCNPIWYTVHTLYCAPRPPACAARHAPAGR